jgi:phosphorylated CTD-interacting factor 1
MEVGRAAAKAAAQALHEGGGGGGGGGANKHVKLITFEVGGKGSGDYGGGGGGGGDEAGGGGKAAAAGGAMKAQLTCGKVKMEINSAHLEKLRALHRKYGSDGGGGGRQREGDVERRFKDSVFCLLARYSAMQGAHYKAGAMQAAIPSQCFAALRDEFDVSLELCASPFNCHFRRYCSAFLDTDGAFGSLGDCFQFHPTEGSFEANPPFDPELIARLVGHLEVGLCTS